MTLGFARGLRGLEAGVIGGLAMIAVLTSGALLRGYVWWQPANLLGSTFYGTRAFRSGPGWATLSGYAFHIVITGVVGIWFGLACGSLERRRQLLLLGGLAGLIWYFFAAAVFWTWVNPLVPLYSLQPDTLVAHALFGMCLGRIGQIQQPVETPPPLPSFSREPGVPLIHEGLIQEALIHEGVTREVVRDGVTHEDLIPQGLIHDQLVPEAEPLAMRWAAENAQTVEDKVE